MQDGREDEEGHHPYTTYSNAENVVEVKATRLYRQTHCSRIYTSPHSQTVFETMAVVEHLQIKPSLAMVSPLCLFYVAKFKRLLPKLESADRLRWLHGRGPLARLAFALRRASGNRIDLPLRVFWRAIHVVGILALCSFGVD